MVNLGFENGFGIVTLNFHGSGHAAEISHRFRVNVQFLGQFETSELISTSLLFERSQNSWYDFRVLAEFLVSTSDILWFTEVFDEGLFQNSNTNTVGLEGVTVNEDFLDTSNLQVWVFNLFRSNVFTLLEFEDVFLSVNDLQSLVVG